MFVRGSRVRNNRRRVVAMRSRSEMAGQSSNHYFSSVIGRHVRYVLPTLAYALVRIKPKSIYYLLYSIQNVFQTTREKTEASGTE
jgi:hypothetical protein